MCLQHHKVAVPLFSYIHVLRGGVLEGVSPAGGLVQMFRRRAVTENRVGGRRNTVSLRRGNGSSWWGGGEKNLFDEAALSTRSQARTRPTSAHAHSSASFSSSGVGQLMRGTRAEVVVGLVCHDGWLK